MRVSFFADSLAPEGLGVGSEAGIFQCDSYALYSNEVIELFPGPLGKRKRPMCRTDAFGQVQPSTVSCLVPHVHVPKSAPRAGP